MSDAGGELAPIPSGLELDSDSGNGVVDGSLLTGPRDRSCGLAGVLWVTVFGELEESVQFSTTESPLNG